MDFKNGPGSANWDWAWRWLAWRALGPPSACLGWAASQAQYLPPMGKPQSSIFSIGLGLGSNLSPNPKPSWATPQTNTISKPKTNNPPPTPTPPPGLHPLEKVAAAGRTRGEAATKMEGLELARRQRRWWGRRRMAERNGDHGRWWRA